MTWICSPRILWALGVCLLFSPAASQSQGPSTPSSPTPERIQKLEAELLVRRAKLQELEVQQARLKTEIELVVAEYRQLEQKLQAEKERLARSGAQPNPASPEERLDRIERHIQALQQELREARAALPRDGKTQSTKFSALDFQSLANQKRTETFHSSRFPGNSLSPLAAGEQRLLEIPFQIGDGILQLGSNELNDKPEKITGIKVGKKLTKLHFLQATAYFLEDEVPIGSYTVHYADGTTETIPIVNGKDVVDWWKYPFSKEPSQGKVAWTGDNGAGKEFEATQWLFLTTWTNPKSDTEITSVDFSSTMNTRCAPFCVAITAEQK